MEIGSQEQAPQAQSKMAGDGAGGSKRDGASRVQLQLQPEKEAPVLATSLGVEERVTTTPLSLITSSTSSSSNSGEADSEGDGNGKGDSTSDPEANTDAGLALGRAGARYMYSPLDGDSDSDSDFHLDDVELFCEEALALLAHEIVCCDCESDLDSEAEEEESEEMESESDPVNDYGQDNLSHNTYQLMFSEEDEEESLGNGHKEENAQVEAVLLLGEDQESEDKSDPKSGESFISASPGCL